MCPECAPAGFSVVAHPETFAPPLGPVKGPASNLESSLTGRIPAVSVADFAGPGRSSYSAELDEQARRKGVRPIVSVDELRADVFESDEELDEFLADLEEFRHQHLA
jgi:hypothetical protein